MRAENTHPSRPLDTTLLAAVRRGLNNHEGMITGADPSVLSIYVRLDHVVRGDARETKPAAAARPLDPWLWLAAAHSRPLDPLVAWASPDGAFTLLAMGVARQVRLDGRARFARARTFCSTHGEHSLRSRSGPPPKRLPRFLAGFAFDDHAPGSPWLGWESGWVVLPELMLVADATETWLVLNLNAPPRRRRSQVLDRAERLIRWVAARDADTRSRRDAGRGEEQPAQAESAGSWRARVDEARRAIRDGLLDKVVLARSRPLEAPEGHRLDATATAQALRAADPRAFVFLFRRPGLGSFVGASPEPLLVVHDGRVETIALAGTAPRGDSDGADRDSSNALLTNPKERREHELVADAIESALRPFCRSLVRPDGPRVVRLPRMLHLATAIRGRLKPDAHVLQLVEALHPTPAVGGWPRPQATAWLADSEPLQRGWYAGPVGWLDGHGNGTLAVAIRSALVQGSRAHLFAGAGIVAGSDADAEWSETELKTSTIQNALAWRREASESP